MSKEWKPTNEDLIEALQLVLGVTEHFDPSDEDLSVIAVARSVLLASLSTAPTRRLAYSWQGYALALGVPEQS